jgi:hypothetical protein
MPVPVLIHEGMIMTWDKRGTERHRCRLRVRIRARGKVYLGHLLNISKGGVRLSTDQIAEIWTGDEVEVVSPEFGSVVGIARWRAPGQLGVMFHDSAYNAANVTMLWRSFRALA